jgi:hypothetical protein
MYSPVTQTLTLLISSVYITALNEDKDKFRNNITLQFQPILPDLIR